MARARLEPYRVTAWMELERGLEHPVEVRIDGAIEDGQITIETVRHNGRSVELTPSEESYAVELLVHADADFEDEYDYLPYFGPED